MTTAVRMVPQVAMVIPYFMLMRNLKLSDTILGLVVTYIPFELTLVIWILKNFFLVKFQGNRRSSRIR